MAWDVIELAINAKFLASCANLGAQGDEAIDSATGEASCIFLREQGQIQLCGLRSTARKGLAHILSRGYSSMNGLSCPQLMHWQRTNFANDEIEYTE
jgi:phage protein U